MNRHVLASHLVESHLGIASGGIASGNASHRIWDDDSQFATIRSLNGFARTRPGFAMLLDAVCFWNAFSPDCLPAN
jgi:hypothetical protein